MMRQTAFSALAFITFISAAQAAPITTIYVGPAGTFDEEPTNYTIAENWSPVGVPDNSTGNSYMVTIPKDVFVDITVAITQLTINAAGSLTVKDTADAAGDFTVGNGFENDATLSVYNSSFASKGTFSNFDSATGTLTGGTFFLQGFDRSASQPRAAVFEFIGANIATNNSSLTLINHAMIVDQLGRDALRNFVNNAVDGVFVVGSGYSFTAPGTFLNAGSITVQPELPAEGVAAGAFAVNAGHQYLQTGGSTTVNGSLTADLSDIQAGTLSLGGTINGTLTVEAAIFFPTGLGGPLVTGDFSLTTESTLQFAIPTVSTIVDGQFTSTNYDQLTVDGIATLGNSTLSVNVAAGYPISNHGSFIILESTGALGGRFGNVSTGSRLTTIDGLGSFVVSQDSQTVRLTDFQTVPPAAQFANLSTRGDVLGGDNILIGGFILNGTEPKNVILRALGPSLAGQGVATPLADPVLELHDSTGAIVANNDNWKDTQQGAVQNTGIPPTDDLESAIVASLLPGTYTIFVLGKSGSTGTALVELYDLSPNADSTLSNLSTRGFVDTANPLIGGFIAGGTGTGNSQFVARAIGPDLANRGILNPLADPLLEVRDVDGNLVASNDDYVPGSDSIIAIDGLEPADPLEAALRLSLAPGNYTALILAKSGGGTALIELYDLYH